MSFNKYLMDQAPITFQPKLALALGNSDKAAILQEIHWWICRKENLNIHDGVRWVYNSYSQWQERFCYISEAGLKRHFQQLEAMGILISANFNKKKFDKTKWYTIDYDALRAFFTRHNLDKTEEEFMYPNRVKHAQEPNKSRWDQIDPTMGSKRSDDGIKLIPPIPDTHTTSLTTCLREDLFVDENFSKPQNPQSTNPSIPLKSKKKPKGINAHSQEFVPVDVWRVFDYWRNRCGYSLVKTLLSEERRLKIEDALQAYDLETCLLAIDGLQGSPFHNGQGDNKNGKTYKDIELALRDPKHIEDFAKLGRELKPKIKQNVAQQSYSADTKRYTQEQCLVAKERFLNRKNRGDAKSIGDIMGDKALQAPSGSL